MNVTVPEFAGTTVVSVPVACTFDFNVAAAKYFHALEGGEVPLTFQFSGTVFYPAADGALQIAQIGWDKEARFRLPAQVWSEMMDLYYPDSAWLRLQSARFSTASTNTSGRRASQPGKRPSRICCLEKGRPHRELRAARKDRERRSLRGFSALPVSQDGGEEPGALAFRNTSDRRAAATRWRCKPRFSSKRNARPVVEIKIRFLQDRTEREWTIAYRAPYPQLPEAHAFSFGAFDWCCRCKRHCRHRRCDSPVVRIQNLSRKYRRRIAHSAIARTHAFLPHSAGRARRSISSH